MYRACEVGVNVHRSQQVTKTASEQAAGRNHEGFVWAAVSHVDDRGSLFKFNTVKFVC